MYSKKKIELFARKNYYGWDNWGLEIPDNKVKITDNSNETSIQKVLELV